MADPDGLRAAPVRVADRVFPGHGSGTIHIHFVLSLKSRGVALDLRRL